MTHDHSQAHGIYTCPMHPEVRQHGPGNCPKCGMTLVPVEESAIQTKSVAPGGFDKVPEGWRGVIYTCPMHPEVRQTEPGSCPICGMGLERDATGALDGNVVLSVATVVTRMMSPSRTQVYPLTFRTASRAASSASRA